MEKADLPLQIRPDKCKHNDLKAGKIIHMERESAWNLVNLHSLSRHLSGLPVYRGQGTTRPVREDFVSGRLFDLWKRNLRETRGEKN